MNGSASGAAERRGAAPDPTSPARRSRRVLIGALAGAAWAWAAAVPAARAAPPDSAAAAPADSGAAADSAARLRPQLVHSGAATEGHRIGSIEIDARNIFEPLPPGRLRAVYRLANRLHVRTRDRTVREQLLFRRGEPWNERRARETERRLRTLNYLQPHRIEAERAGDSVRVTVVTRDVWSTALEFNIERADRRQYGSYSVTERNLLGLGKSVSVSYDEEPTGIRRSLSIDDPKVMGTWLRLQIGAEQGTSGSRDRMSVGVPFYAQETPYSYGVRWERGSGVGRLYLRGDEAAQIARSHEDREFFWGAGRRRQGQVRRLTVSFAALDRALGDTRPVTAAPLPAEFLGGPESWRLRRIAVEGRLWQPRFVERTHANFLGAVEDFDLGHSLSLKFGAAPEIMGSTTGEGFAALALDSGVDTPLGYGTLRLTASTRWRHDPRDLLGNLDARWFRSHVPGHTLALAARGFLGEEMPRDFQLVAGGLTGLRAHPVHALAGRRLWLLNAEDRWMVGRDWFGLVSLGVVSFLDAGQAWGPGAGEGGWRVGAGAGLRVALSTWSPDHLLRIDLAWPLDARSGRREPVLSFGSNQAF